MLYLIFTSVDRSSQAQLYSETVPVVPVVSHFHLHRAFRVNRRNRGVDGWHWLLFALWLLIAGVVSVLLAKLNAIKLTINDVSESAVCLKNHVRRHPTIGDRRSVPIESAVCIANAHGCHSKLS